MKVSKFLISDKTRWIAALDLLLIVVLAWVCAGFFWQLFAPHSPQVRLTPSVQAPRSASMQWSGARTWFGSGASNAGASNLSAQLIAVIAGGDDYSAAIFTGLDASMPTAVKVGQELKPGIKLTRVERDHVELLEHGTTSRLLLQGANASAVAIAGAVPGGVNGGRATGGMAAPPQAPPGDGAATEGPSSTLTRGQLASAMQNANISDWAKGISTASVGGIQIDNPSQQPFAGPLGLQSGDVLKSVNGANLAQNTDISTLYTAFSQQSQVQLVLIRHGNLLRLRYQIQP
ncbi:MULTISPECIES: type II secretion system protein N [Silvimonas]|uniref:type II secretion system protein N n=1 Tax=Silvimonas TaxID=300264 RepID=UPI0024B37799|nr:MULTISPECIES: type II secretion system protein N [Silvimonas]MDR3426422.1 type II secretion system protein N [Silvimonas sp.]